MAVITHMAPFLIVTRASVVLAGSIFCFTEAKVLGERPHNFMEIRSAIVSVSARPSNYNPGLPIIPALPIQPGLSALLSRAD
jgi:hypothetical protein